MLRRYGVTALGFGVDYRGDPLPLCRFPVFPFHDVVLS